MEKTKEVLDVLKRNACESYRSPNKLSDKAEASKMRKLYSETKEASSLFEDIVLSIAKENDMVCFFHNRILDGTRRKIRPYFWGEMLDDRYLSSPESISIFAEVDAYTGNTRFRVSLELDGKRAQKDDYLSHNKILCFPEKKRIYLRAECWWRFTYVVL